VGFNKGVLETHSAFLCGFLFCCGFSSGLLRVVVRCFWVIQWTLYNCDLLWVSARVFETHSGLFVVSWSAVGSAVVAASAVLSCRGQVL